MDDNIPLDLGNLLPPTSNTQATRFKIGLDSNKDNNGKFRFTYSEISPIYLPKNRKQSSKYNILSLNNGRIPGEVEMNDYTVLSEAPSHKNRN